MPNDSVLSTEAREGNEEGTEIFPPRRFPRSKCTSVQASRVSVCRGFSVVKTSVQEYKRTQLDHGAKGETVKREDDFKFDGSVKLIPDNLWKLFTTLEMLGNGRCRKKGGDQQKVTKVTKGAEVFPPAASLDQAFKRTSVRRRRPWYERKSIAPGVVGQGLRIEQLAMGTPLGEVAIHD